MTKLIACLSTGKGTWTEVIKLIDSEPCEKVFLLTNDFGKEKFTHEKAELIVVKGNVNEMRDQIHASLKNKLSFEEVAVNLISGTGTEHMAIISAVLKLGVGMRIVTTEENKIKEV